MSRKQFLILLAALLVLGAVGAAITWWDRSSWQKADLRIGQKMLPQLKLADIGQVTLRDGRNEVTVYKSGSEWRVKDRADFPADSGRLADMLNKVADLKIVQTEKLTEAQRNGFQLVEPAKKAAGDATGQGTVVEMKDAGGKPLARLLLGKIVTKRVIESPAPGEPPKEFDKPVGRHLFAGDDNATMIVVSDGVVQAEAAPDAWLFKEALHVDRTRAIYVTGANGAPTYSVTRIEEGQWWTFGDTGERPDQQKAQDSVSPLYAVNIVDVVADPKAVQTGLDRPLIARAETFDKLTYTIKIGNKIPGQKPEDNRYYVSFAIAGDPPKERVPEKGEKPEDTEKKAKEYAEYRVKLLEQVEREKKFSKWTFIFPARPVEPLLRSRAEMQQDKKPPAKK